MIYELRLYSVAQGRMADCHARFRDHFPALFHRHGINSVGRWTASAGPFGPRFVYMMAYHDYTEREACWASFYKDGEWWRLRSETNAGFEMIERYDLFFLKPNISWKMSHDVVSEPIEGIHELVFQEIAAGQSAAANEFLANTYLSALQRAGAKIMAVLDMVSGVYMPQIVFMYAWESAAHRQVGWESMNTNHLLNEAWDTQRRELGHTIFMRSDINLLEPSSYALPYVPLTFNI